MLLDALYPHISTKFLVPRSIQLACLVASGIPFLALSLPVRNDLKGLALRGTALWMLLED